MKKLFVFTACLLALNTARAQYATVRVMDNTGYASGVMGQFSGSNGPCSPDKIVSGWGTVFNPSAYTSYTTSSFTTSWLPAGPIPSVFTQLVMVRPLGGGAYEFGTTGPIALCSIPPSGRVITGTFTTSGTPYTVDMMPVAGTLDIIIKP